jgi:hypothetical protein
MAITPEERRAAEERVLAEYEAQLLATTDLAEALAKRPSDRPYEPVWPLHGGRVRVTELELGIFVEELHLERSYPDTVVCFTFRSWRKLECLLTMGRSVWDLESLCGAEPKAPEFWFVHIEEDLTKHLGRALDGCARGEVVDLGRTEPWATTLPRLVAGEIRVSPREQELAARALARLEAEGLSGG